MRQLRPCDCHCSTSASHSVSPPRSRSRHAADSQNSTTRVDAAHMVLHELMDTPDKGLPEDIASHATCVAVIPGFKKGAFVVGAQYGQGVVTCRTGHGWSAPAFIQLTGASFGFQIGGQATDLVLVAVTHHALRAPAAGQGQARRRHRRSRRPRRPRLAGVHHRTRQRRLPHLLAQQGPLRRHRPLRRRRQPEPRRHRRPTTATISPTSRILSGGVRTPPGAVHFVRTVNELFHAHARDAK